MSEKMKVQQNRIKQQVEADKPIRWRLTERKVDRDGEVVEPLGVDLENYKRNPVVLWAHNIYEQRPPIGKVLTDTIVQTHDYLEGEVIFDINDPFAALIDRKVREGFINTGSIGFRVKTIGREPVLPGQTGATLIETELLEFSIVPVPANVGATRKDYEAFIAEANQVAGKQVIDSDWFFKTYAEYFKQDDPTSIDAKGEEWLYQKPYPNEHAARLQDPDKYVRFRRQNNKFGDGIHAIWGIMKDGTVELQSIRFDKSKFTVAQAKKWLADHGYEPIEFEEAANEKNNKVGAVLNARNRQIIENAIVQLDELRLALQEMLEMAIGDNDNNRSVDADIVKLEIAFKQLEKVEGLLAERRVERALDSLATKIEELKK